MKWVCEYCNSEADERIVFCPVCFRSGSYTPIVHRPGLIGRVNEPDIMTAEELAKSGKLRHRLGGPWKEFFPDGIGKPFFGVIWGVPGAGKSTLALLLAAAWKKPALYLTFEEGFGVTLRERVARLSITGVNFAYPNSVDSLIEMSEKYDLIVEDSLQMGGIDPPSLKALFIDNGKSLVVCSQVNKDGTVRGGLAVGHLTDVSIELPEYGKYKIRKNRYGPTKEGVWREPEGIYWQGSNRRRNMK